MAATYDGDPDGDRKDEVRMMVGDTDPAEWLLQDEEITYLLGQHVPATGKPAWGAAAAACDAIAGKFGRRAQRSIGPLSIAAQQQWEHYRDMADRFRLLLSTNGRGGSGNKVAAPVLGGGGRTYLGGSSSTYDPAR